MASTNTVGSLTRLPGRTSDNSARALREQFLAGDIDIDNFLRANGYRFPKTSAERFANQVQTYATASIVIDQFWTYLKAEPVAAVMAQLRKNCDSDSYDECIHAFSRYCDGVISMFQKRFIDDTRRQYKKKKHTKAFEQQLCFFSVSRKRYPKLKGLPFPSSKDLVTLLVRMAGVAPKVFARDIGREATRDELLAILRHPSILRFFTEIMSNDRKATYPLFALFEGQNKGNLNDLDRDFDPQFFEIQVSGEILSLRLKQSVVNDHVCRHTKAAKRRAERNQPPRPVLECPALYTGHIGEMYNWTLSLLESWI
jgi:hypothetical protein